MESNSIFEKLKSILVTNLRIKDLVKPLEDIFNEEINVIALYFSTRWCPPTNCLTTTLEDNQKFSIKNC